MSASVESRYHIGLQIVSVWVFAVRQDWTKKIYAVQFSGWDESFHGDVGEGELRNPIFLLQDRASK